MMIVIRRTRSRASTLGPPAIGGADFLRMVQV
jgi:hypothetical protein